MKIKTFDEYDLELLVSDFNSNSKYKGDILMLHGIFSNQHESGRFQKYSTFLNNIGFTTYRYDHRGHGNNPIQSKDMSVIDTILDFIYIVRELTNINKRDLNIIASSYGAAIFLLALQLDKNIPLNKIILLNPVVDFHSTFINPLGEQLKEIFSKENILKLETTGRDIIGPNDTTISLSFISELKLMFPFFSIPLLNKNSTVIHGNNDTAVSFDVCKSKFEINQQVRFIEIENANHAFREPDSEAQVFSIFSSIFKNDQ